MAQSPTPTDLTAEGYQYYDGTSFHLQSFPLSHINKTHLENGNRIIMPSSAMHTVMSQKKITCPMTFEITNLDSGKASHCGVLEFSAEDGCVYIPDWMMHTLVLKDGQFVKVEKTGMQPHVVSLFDTDCELDVMQPELKQLEADFAKFKPFTGVSRKLDEKISTNTNSVVAKIESNYLNEMSKLDAVTYSRNYDGTAVSGKGDINGVGHKNEVKKFQPFTGRKYTLLGS